MTIAIAEDPETGPTRRLRLGFLGTGWIGRHRMGAILDTGLVEAAMICDPDAASVEAARSCCDGKDLTIADDLEAMLASSLDGIVIATPSALHATQATIALEAGVAVFCQKPLGRTQQECLSVVDAARNANLPLGLDLSYRGTEALAAVRKRLCAGEIGKVFAADLAFHNAYGPDKPWFRDASLSGGGCMMDLGVHLVDALLWCLDQPRIDHVNSRLLKDGARLQAGEVEDYAVATLDLQEGAVARIACSWNLHAGRDAEIFMRFHGTGGSLAFENVGGSFYDFRSILMNGTRCEVLTEGRDEWGGRMAALWTRQLASGEGFDPDSWSWLNTAAVLDRIYGRRQGD